MKRVTDHQGSHTVEPRRKRKRSSGERAQRAARLVAKLEQAGRERRDVLATTARPNVTERLTRDLEELHGVKRAMRREIYEREPRLEGHDVRRRGPGAGA